MKNNLFHRSIQLFLGIVILFFNSNSLNAQTATISAKLFHNSSTTANSMVTYSISISNGWTQGVSTVTSVVLQNLVTGVNAYATGTGYSSGDYYGTIPGSFAAGSYELKIIVSTPKFGGRGLISVTSTQNIWIGNKVFWENCFDMEPGVSQYSVKRSKATPGQGYSYVQSFNSLAASTLGWVEMSKLNSNINDSRVYWILEPMSNPRSFTPTDNLTHVEFYRNGSGVSGIKVRYKQAGGTYRDSIIPGVAATDKVRFQRNANGTAILQINNSLTTKFSFPSNITGALKITVLGKQLNDQADEIATSYSYPSSNYPISTRFHANNTENNNMGSITTVISPLSGFTSPYNYFVTASPMDDMKSIYKYLKDSIYTAGVDSTTFFHGASSSTTMTSPMLPSGSYYANVFDSKGVRIFTNKQELMPAYVYGQQNKFENSYNEFMSTSPDSYITLNTYVTEEDRGSLVYYITNTTAEQSFGVLSENDNITGGTGSTHYTQLKYGFSVKSGKLYTIVTGVKADSVSVKANVPIELVFADGVASFLQEGISLTTSALPASFTYKSGAYIKSWGIPISINPVNLKFRPYKIATLVNDNACGKNSGDLKVTYTGLHNMSIHSNTSFTLKNITDDANASPPTAIATVVSGTTYQDIAAGVYSLEGNIYLVPTGSPPGTAPTASYLNIKQVIYIGPRMSWDPYENIQTWPQSNTATHYAVGSSAVTNTNTAKAVATNILDPQVSGWTVFTASQFTQITKYAQFFLSEAPIMASLNSFEWTMPCVSFYGGVVISVTSANSGPASVSIIPGFAPSVPLLIRRASNGYVRYRQNYTMLREVTNYTNARWKPAFFSQYANTGIREVYSSFPCKPYTADMYAQLKYDMDGYYHIMKNGDINFVFNQEYNTADLVFNLYNSNDVLIKTQADFPPINTTNGMNYETLVVRDPYCIGRGFFYLEFINSKKEKLYLRFYNDYTGCIPTMEGEGQGFGQ